jgi:phenylalanyl-tRNA synthetase beta chain
MRVPYEWLKEFVDIEYPPEAVIDRLTMIGLEVEAVEHADDDVVFEVNVTPNRPDCLSLIGIARELSAAYGMPLKFPDHNVVAGKRELDFNVDIIEPKLCHRYAGRIVRNVSVKPSPEWLRKRLEKCGIRSINNIVDVTNYVLLEFGHPLHAFDLGTLRGKIIRVGTPKGVNGSSKAAVKTLDGAEREVSGDTLLIWDSERPVAIAGVMGGHDTEVKETTNDVFIESAYFDPVSIRRTSKALGLKTESSYRFERGTDIKGLKKALDRAALLMKEVADGTIYGKIDIYPKRYFPAEVNVRYERINRILGLKLTKREIHNYLKGLGLEITEEGRSGFKLKPPAFRRDITMEADVIEEIARHYGYDRIPSELPRAVMGVDVQKADIRGQKVKNTVKESLLNAGFTEVINYSFMGVQDIELLGIGAEDERRNLIRIRNPLREEESFMRTTLIPSLIRNLLHNLAHGNRDLRLFEMAKVFISTASNPLPDEREHFAVLYYKEKVKSLYKENVSDFYIVKGVVEAILNDLRIYNYSFARSKEPFLHPGQSADIFLGGSKAGYIGALSPEMIDSLQIKAQKPSVIVVEMDINRLISYIVQDIKYKPLPKYPYVERDTAIVVDSSLEASRITGYLKSYSSDLIEDIAIFDVYQGGNIAEGKKSITFNVRYRSSDRTLTDEEVDVLHKSLVDYILDKTNGQSRQ